MSETDLPRSIQTRYGDTPSFKILKLKTMPTTKPKFKKRNSVVVVPSLSYLNNSSDEGSPFPGSPRIEGGSNSSFDFQKRSIKPKLLKRLSVKTNDTRATNLPFFEGFKKKSSQKSRNEKLLYTDMNKIFKTTAEEDCRDQEESEEESEQESVLEDQLSSYCDENRPSTVGFSMKTKKLRTGSLYKKEEGIQSLQDSYFPLFYPQEERGIFEGEERSFRRKKKLVLTSIDELREKIHNASKSSSIDKIFSQLLKFK